MEVAHTTYIPTHKYPPKSTRAEFSRQQSAVWEQLAANPGVEELWVLDYIFTRVILPAGQGPRQSDAYAQGRIVRERLRRWKEGMFRELWEEAVTLTSAPPKSKNRRTGAPTPAEEKSLEDRNAARALGLAQDGQYTKSIQALDSWGMAEQTRDTEEIMKNKHPPATGPSTFQRSTNSSQLQFSCKEVEKAALSFKKSSAPGPSGQRPEHLKVVLKDAPANRTVKSISALSKVVNLMARGEVPPQVAPYLCGARLHAAIKKDGGLRPIAVGNLLRRLTSKLVASTLAHRGAAHLAPHQMGVGVRGGL